MKPIVELRGFSKERDNDCRYPVGDAPEAEKHLCAGMFHAKHLFCAAVTGVGETYCVEHKPLCTAGKKGKDWQALAGMMAATEHHVLRTEAISYEVASEILGGEMVGGGSHDGFGQWGSPRIIDVGEVA